MPERNYTGSELRTMQEEAARRVAEMRRIANEHLNRSNSLPHEERREKPPQKEKHPSPGKPQPVRRSLPVEFSAQESISSPSEAFDGIIQKLGLENDRLILIGLLLLLINEGADSVLILAVFYLLI